jgi:hypothetical protein
MLSMSTSISSAEFPLTCVIQPAFLLGYVSTCAVPFIFERIEFAGVYVGMSMVLVALVRFSTMARKTEPVGLEQPLLPSHPVYLIGSLESGISCFTQSMLLMAALFNTELVPIFLLVPSVLVSISYRSSWRYMLAGLGAACILWFSGLWPEWAAEITASSTGVLFQSLASQCLPLWDYAHQTRLGFKLSSIALLSLYIAASSLKLVT